MGARVPRYGVCDPPVTAPLLAGEHPSGLIWAEKGEKIQDVAAFQERLKGKVKQTHTLHHHTSVCDGRLLAAQEKFTDEAKEEGSKTLPANFRTSKVRGAQSHRRNART